MVSIAEKATPNTPSKTETMILSVYCKKGVKLIIDKAIINSNWKASIHILIIKLFVFGKKCGKLIKKILVAFVLRRNKL